ncbi:MAG: hypothetical protein AB203_03430 [Parcubacteria bacterium C7867-008]|nr:MAG: hypothetical protein AB203_03430 [Parcubacteria bacterium C7867-008]
MEYTEMNNKHKALIGVGALVLIFLIFAIWYMATHQAPAPVGPVIATSTPVTTSSSTQTITDNSQYYEIKATYPASTLLKQTTSERADTEAVSIMKTFVEQEIARFKDNGNFANLTQEDIQIQGLGNGRKYTLDAEYQTYQGKHTVSYVYTINLDTLGAHGNSYYRVFTFDTAAGQSLELDDLFVSNSGYLEKLSNISRVDLPGVISAKFGESPDMEDIKSGTTADAENFQSWYIEGTNLVLIFPPYQVGPYTIGTTLLPIQLSRLGDMLKATYVP